MESDTSVGEQAKALLHLDNYAITTLDERYITP